VERGVLRFSAAQSRHWRWRDWAATAPAARDTYESGGTRIVNNYFVGSLGMDSVVQIEESMMDPCYDVWE